jgi:DNA-binding GntR family transcriptional regulator
MLAREPYSGNVGSRLVRSGLDRLSAEGLVAQQDQKGFSVASPARYSRHATE